MWGLTHKCPTEVSGLGIVDEHDPCRVVDFFVVEQSCTDASTEMDPTAVANLIADMRDKGIHPSRWRVWWHSHAKMKAFFSGTDEDNVERYASEKALWSVVTNHADAQRVMNGQMPTEVYIRVDVFDPDQPKNINSPMRYTIEGCGWRVATLPVVTDDWFKESLAKLNTRRPEAQRLNIQPNSQPNDRQAWARGLARYEGEMYPQRFPQATQVTRQEDPDPRVWHTFTRDDDDDDPWDTRNWQATCRDDERVVLRQDRRALPQEEPKSPRAAQEEEPEDVKILHRLLIQMEEVDAISLEKADKTFRRYRYGQLSATATHNLLVYAWNEFVARQSGKIEAIKDPKLQEARQEWLERVHDRIERGLASFVAVPGLFMDPRFMDEDLPLQALEEVPILEVFTDEEETNPRLDLLLHQEQPI